MTHSKLLQAISAIAAAQDKVLKDKEARAKLKQDLLSLGFLTEEIEPLFRSSAAFNLQTADLSFLRSLPEVLSIIRKMPGEKGDPGDDGYTPVKGVDYFDGEPGIDGKTPVKGVDYFDGEDGKDAEVDTDELRKLAEKPIMKHEKEFKHEDIHDVKMLGELELDLTKIEDGQLFRREGNKIVGVDLPKSQQRSFSSGISTLQSIPVTASRELDGQGIYVIDASSGNITITIPSASGREAYMYELIRIDATSNTVTVNPTGSETLSGMTTYQLQQWSDIKLFGYQNNYLLRG